MRTFVATLLFALFVGLAVAQPGAGQTIPPNVYLPIIARDQPTATAQPTATNAVISTPTPTATATKVASTPTPTATATQALVYICDHDAYNCSDFNTQAAAQEVYNYCSVRGFGDIHGLDGNNNNGLACESLP